MKRTIHARLKGEDLVTDELISVAEDSTRGSFFLVSGTAISTVVMAISTILVGRLVGSELYGKYTLALVIPSLFLLFADLGINQGIIRFTASLRLKGETHRAAKIIKHGLLIKAIAGVLLFLVNYTLAGVLASVLLQRPDMAFYIRIVSTSILFQVILSTASSAFVGLDKTEYHALAANVQAFAKAIISISLVLLGFGVLGALSGYVSGFAVASIAATAILFFLLREKQDSNEEIRIRESFKTLMHYGTPLYASALLSGFIPFYQSILLSVFTSYGDIGDYNAALNFATVIAIFSSPITTALLPAFSKIDSSARHRIKEFFKLANKYTALLVMPIAALMIVFSQEIVQVIYGSTFQSAPLLLAMYYLVYLLVGIGYLVLVSFYSGIGETKIALKMSALIFLVIIILSPFLTKMFGAPGLVAAYLLANTTGTLYGSYTARKKFQIEFDTRSIAKIYLISATSIGPSLLLRFMHTSGLLTLIVGAASFLFIYLTLVPLAKIVNLPELNRVAQIIQKIRVLGLVGKPILKYEQMILSTRAKTTQST
jgi:O-antigen/teichoic acid export membrane protein